MALSRIQFAVVFVGSCNYTFFLTQYFAFFSFHIGVLESADTLAVVAFYRYYFAFQLVYIPAFTIICRYTILPSWTRSMDLQLKTYAEYIIGSIYPTSIAMPWFLAILLQDIFCMCYFHSYHTYLS